MDIGIRENSEFLIFENDIVPSQFFFEYADKCFKFYKDEDKFYGLTGYAPFNRIKIKNQKFLNTFLSYRSNSWSFGTKPKIAKKFINFLDKNSKEQLGKIIYENVTIAGKDLYNHYLQDLNPNKHLIGYAWIAFMLYNKGFFVHPSEHLVSFYGNDEFAENCYSYGKSRVNECDLIFSKETYINFKSGDKFSFNENDIVVDYNNPNMINRVLKKICRITNSLIK